LVWCGGGVGWGGVEGARVIYTVGVNSSANQKLQSHHEASMMLLSTEVIVLLRK